MPDMKLARRAVMARPRTPFGRKRDIIRISAELYSAPGGAVLLNSGRTATATSPGITTRIGMRIFGNAARIGVVRAAVRFFEASARWTTRKSVVQYPNDNTKPRPITTPTQLTPSGLSAEFPRFLQAWKKAAG